MKIDSTLLHLLEMKWTEEMELTNSKAMIRCVNEDEKLIINSNGKWRWNVEHAYNYWKLTRSMVTY